MLYPYINVTNCTPMYISNLFSCQKNVKKAKELQLVSSLAIFHAINKIKKLDFVPLFKIHKCI